MCPPAGLRTFDLADVARPDDQRPVKGSTMSTITTPAATTRRHDASPRRRRRRNNLLAVLLPLGAIALLAAGCGAGQEASAHETSTTAPTTSEATSETAPPTTVMDHGDHGAGHEMDPKDQAAAMLATAAFQDVASAEAAGYASSIDALGCFQDPTRGGMGVHYINGSLMDDQVDITKPEALVYELDATGHITGLVAHEYIVPVDAWTSDTPPQLFGVDFHRHPTLPLWVLHTWLWKANPTGMFQDWNPAVR